MEEEEDARCVVVPVETQTVLLTSVIPLLRCILCGLVANSKH